ncbi:mycothiol synthase [Angustibacter luteus]|uniref:Mycothiol acetyltransferase n=1 Tax=Angustibacter luteus TaxID=658456 RepID=A0ABW1JBT5_9ACTN
MPSDPTSEFDVRLEVLERLAPDDLSAVTALVAAATEADGLHPLSEHVMLHLPSTAPGADRHLLVFATPAEGGAERLAGYGHLDPTDAVDGASAEVVVHPDLRGHGVGRLMVGHLQELSPDGRLRLWAHGQQAGARALAESLGYVSVRKLWQMRRSLRQDVPALDPPPGYTLRAFRPGADDEAWLAVNAAAFAHHPEQGRWTAQDLAFRMAEDWFDPAGFLLLDGPDGDLAGFHWTKVHGSDPAARHGHDRIGEVYVVGVSPAHQGHGLGAVLTVAGLRHLRSQGLTQVMLYVDGDNEAAVRTYSRLGFTRAAVDVQYSRPLPSAALTDQP